MRTNAYTGTLLAQDMVEFNLYKRLLKGVDRHVDLAYLTPSGRSTTCYWHVDM